MSQEQVSIIIGKAVTDSEFRTLLFSNPEQALTGYNLTDEEKQALKEMKKEDLEEFGGKLDKRITKSKLW